MGYLFGDSSSSKLEVNYIELLRDAIEFAVEVLLASQRVHKWNEGSRERRLAAEADTGRLDNLELRLHELLQGVDTGRKESPAGRCAGRIARSVTEVVSGERSAVKSGLNDDLARMAAQITRERSSLLGVLEKLLVKHDLPDAKQKVVVSMVGTTNYEAKLTESALHLESVLELEIPTDSIYAQPLRVEKVMELEVKAPDRRGWLHKTVKLVPHKLAKQYVVEVAHSEVETLIRLRGTTDISDTGFDITISADEVVSLTRVNKEGEEAKPFEPIDDDADKLIELAGHLVAPLTDIATRRNSLVDATLDGKALDKHDNPALLVERLIKTMSPVVQEIAEHSLTPGELVIKRLLGDDRREEIFIAKDELEHKLRRLSPRLRRLFAPLGLGTAVNQPVASPGDDEVTAVAPGAGERDSAQVSGDIDVPARRSEDDEEVSSAAIPIEDDWLEEASDVEDVAAVPEPVDESLSGALRELEAAGADETPPKSSD